MDDYYDKPDSLSRSYLLSTSNWINHIVALILATNLRLSAAIPPYGFSDENEEIFSAPLWR